MEHYKKVNMNSPISREGVRSLTPWEHRLLHLDPFRACMLYAGELGRERGIYVNQ